MESFTSQEKKSGFRNFLSSYQAKLDEEYKKEESVLKSKSSNKLKKYHCLDGVNPNKYKDNYKKYLQEFAKGPCNPVVIIPGITGTKLVGCVDCKVVQSEEPTLFKECGWEKCDGTPGKDGVPLKEYRLWIPKLTDGVGLESERALKCWTLLLGFRITKKGKYVQHSSPKGVTVSVYGNTANTRSRAQCGFRAIEDMVTGPFKLKIFSQFKGLKEKYQSMGYIIGLTMQALPYDWRENVHENGIAPKFKNIIQSMHNMVTKKVVLVAHSMGNIVLLHNILDQKQEFASTYINSYFAIAPPYLGSPKVPAVMIGMDDSGVLALPIAELGVGSSLYKDTFGTFPSFLDLLPNSFFQYYRNEDWIKHFTDRISEERVGKSDPAIKHDKNNLLTKIFPPFNSVCLPGYESRQEKCFSGFFKYKSSGKIKNYIVNGASQEAMIKTYGFTNNTEYFFQKEKSYLNNNIDYKMRNPKVQVNVIYSSMTPTYSQFRYLNDPRYKTLRGKFGLPEVVNYELGDGSVLVTSAILPAIRWAYEHAEGLSQGAMPVTFVEMCSQMKNKDTIFDISLPDGSQQVSKSQYIGIPCECKPTNRQLKNKSGDGSCSQHSVMMTDHYMIEFIVKSSMTGVKGEMGLDWTSKTNEEIVSFIENCELFFDWGEDN